VPRRVAPSNLGVAGGGRVITVTYLYSACVVIRTPEVSVLCDPWFSEGAYDGSWYHYPPFEHALERVVPCDLVYVSHLHPDHYDADFLARYLERHPEARVVVADFESNFLSRKMTADGIRHEVHSRLEIGATRLALLPNGHAEYDIDSALVVARGHESVVNMNDNLYHQPQIDRILDLLDDRPSIALLGYTGAGPYPQTYYTDEAELARRAADKKRAFFARYRRMRDALDPRVTIPFAGKYLLGGHLHELNPWRGVADAVEVTAFDPNAVVLDDGGEASIDTRSLKPTAVRTRPYDPDAMAAYAAGLADLPMDSERYLGNLPVSAIPFRRLLPRSYAHAQRRSPCREPYYFCLRLPGEWFVANAERDSDRCWFARDVSDLEPRSEIEIDPRYLFGLLTGIFHWNNADVGSQYRTHRVPDLFLREAQAFLSFLHIG
jgi:UDP-MurNAc hydroxylase